MKWGRVWMKKTEAVLDAEPVILENARPAAENYKYGRKRRWPHMTEEAESALGAKWTPTLMGN